MSGGVAQDEPSEEAAHTGDEATVSDAENAGDEDVAATAAGLIGHRRPVVVRFDPDAWAVAVPSAGLREGSLRLVVRRGLYDLGTLVQSAESLAPLASSQELRVAPQALKELGIEPGDEVRVRSVSCRDRGAGHGRRCRPVWCRAPPVQCVPQVRDGRLGAPRLVFAGRRRPRGEGELMPDPLFAHGADLGTVIIVAVKVLVAFGVLLVSVMLAIWFLRKVISDMQNRVGPNRAGPYGILQTLADGLKLFFKEDLLPDQADRFVFRLAPYLALLPALLIFTIVPLGGVVTIAHHVVELQVADPPMGILFLLALSSVSVYGTMLAGGRPARNTRSSDPSGPARADDLGTRPRWA